MRVVRFSTRANNDLTRLRAFILKKSSRAAIAASQRIIEGLDLLSLFPEVGTPMRGNVRQLVIKHGRSRYVARYRLAGDDIVITRIWHGKEDRPR